MNEPWPWHTYEWVMSHMRESFHCVCQSSMGWLRLVGSFKLQVSFAKEPYTRDDILQKRPIILRSLLIEATPYLVCPWWVVSHDTHLNDSRLTWIRDVTYRMNESFLLALIIWTVTYGVATISRLPKNIGLFCKRALWKRLYSAKETSFAKEPYERDYILQKRPMFLRSLLIIATPYHINEGFMTHKWMGRVTHAQVVSLMGCLLLGGSIKS